MEFLARQICMEEGISFSYSYREGVNTLQSINNIVQIEERDLMFAKKLYSKDLKIRFTWLKNIFESLSMVISAYENEEYVRWNMEYKFDYTIHPDNSPKEFKKACSKIEALFPNAIKRELLVGVDGSTIQVYSQDEKNIVVYDDYDVGAVFAKSEIDLSEIFKEMPPISES